VLFGGAFGDALYLVSQERIGVSRAFPILNTYPIITYMLALFFLDEVLDIGTITGIVLSICGVVLVSREISVEVVEDKAPLFDWMGLALAILSSIMFAFATVFMELGVADIDPIDANMFRMLIGSMIMVPIFSVSVRNRTRLLSRRAVKVVAIAGFFGMGLSSLLYLASIRLVGATIGAVLGSTAPLFALPFSILHLKERITWKGILGTIATIIGIWLVVIGV
jgi:drug/metabolite transporter (DMT)-like permease